MTSPLLRVERQGAVAVLTFSDPDRLNAMTEAMGHALRDTVAELRDDPALRAAVLTGAGRAFSAGGDLAMIESKGKAASASPGGAVREENRAFMERFYKLYLSVRELPFPTVAAINGPAIGAGLCVALGCDIRIAAREAKLGLNFARLGIHPGMGATWTLPRPVKSSSAATRSCPPPSRSRARSPRARRSRSAARSRRSRARSTPPSMRSSPSRPSSSRATTCRATCRKGSTRSA